MRRRATGATFVLPAAILKCTVAGGPIGERTFVDVDTTSATAKRN